MKKWKNEKNEEKNEERKMKKNEKNEKNEEKKWKKREKSWFSATTKHKKTYFFDAILLCLDDWIWLVSPEVQHNENLNTFIPHTIIHYTVQTYTYKYTQIHTQTDSNKVSPLIGHTNTRTPLRTVDLKLTSPTKLQKVSTASTVQVQQKLIFSSVFLRETVFGVLFQEKYKKWLWRWLIIESCTEGGFQNSQKFWEKIWNPPNLVHPFYKGTEGGPHKEVYLTHTYIHTVRT